MKPPVTLIMLFFICAVFFFLGFLSYSKFYHWVLPNIEGIQYKINLGAVGDNQDTFAVIIAAVPLLLFFTWQLIPLYNEDKKTLSALIVLLCMSLAVYIRYKMLVAEFTSLVESSTNRSSLISIPFEQLAFEWYMAGGLVVGCIITYLAFHNTIIRRRILINGDSC